MTDAEILARLRELKAEIDFSQRSRCYGPRRDKWSAVAGLLEYAIARAEQDA